MSLSTDSSSDDELNTFIQEMENFKRIQLADQDAYSKLKNNREKATFSMMMKMNPDALTAIRKEFFAREDSITLDEFIYIIQKHLINRPGDNSFVMETPEQREFGTNMYELFKDIDVNGDGNLEWQEYTSFTVEKANLLNKRQKLTSIAHYHDTSVQLDCSARIRHRHDLSRFVNIPTLSQFALIEEHKNNIFVFNSRLGKLLATIQTEAAPIAIECIAEKDKVSVVTSGADMTLSTYALDDPNPKRKYKVQTSWATPGVQMSLAYAYDSKLLYSGGTNGNIYSWDVTERNLVSTLSDHTDIVMSLIVLKKLNNIASASLDKSVRIWDSHTKDCILTLQGHRKGVFDLSYSPYHRLLFSCGFEHDALVWSPFVNSIVYRLRGHNSSLVGCQTVEGTNELITADTSGIFKLWDIRNFSCIQTFSANLSGEGLKDSSKLTCFFHSKLKSRNAQQEEDDSRIYAASKLLFSFDQARVVHEVTTDYFNVFWMLWIPATCSIITASDKNVIVWDALVGSKTFTHQNICGEEISACCLDDRKRKIIIGDIKGHISIFNCSNGQEMKSVHRPYDSAVCSLDYYNETKRFLAGFVNGQVAIFDENVMEECLLVRQIEVFGNLHRQLSEQKGIDLNLVNARTPIVQRSIRKVHQDNKFQKEMLCARFDPRSEGVVTVDSTDGMLCIWDYASSKNIIEIQACDKYTTQIVQMIILSPYPFIMTSDSNGNLIVWGSKGYRWIGKSLFGFVNINPVHSDMEPPPRKFDNDSTSRRILPPKDCVTPAMVREFEEDMNSREEFDEISIDSSYGHEYRYIMSLHSVAEKENTLQQAKQLFAESEAKWGHVSSAHALGWNADLSILMTGDELGTLRCFTINDALVDLMKVHLLDPSVEQVDHRIQNICKQLGRDDASALAPIDRDITTSFLLAHKNNHNSYLGVRFKWALYAHADRIINCTCTKEGILTSGADRLVKMWTYDGIAIGTLLQSVPIGTRSKSWDLIIDVKSIIAKENKELDEIIQQVSELAEKVDNPNIHELDFSGMELGAESANFSQSVLRQRIDRTATNLGLNFPSMSKSNLETKLLDDEFTVQTLTSSVSAGSKSLINALKEIKSAETDIDWDLRHKAMTYVQQRRRATKLEILSKAYEEKSGVQLNIKKKQTTIVVEKEAKDKDFAELSHSAATDHSTVNDELYSLDSLNKMDNMSTRKDLHVNGKIAESMKKAHDNGIRTISMLKSCRKYTTFDKLDEAINDVTDESNKKPTTSDYEVVKQNKERKFRSLLVGSNGTIPGNNMNLLAMRGSSSTTLLSQIEDQSSNFKTNLTASLTKTISNDVDDVIAAALNHTGDSNTAEGSVEVIH